MNPNHFARTESPQRRIVSQNGGRHLIPWLLPVRSTFPTLVGVDGDVLWQHQKHIDGNTEAIVGRGEAVAVPLSANTRTQPFREQQHCRWWVSIENCCYRVEAA